MNVEFLVTGQGRSGTQWLAQILNKMTSSVTVFHEPCGQSDSRVYQGFYFGSSDPLKYFPSRVKRMEDLSARHPEKGFAEVTSYIRYCADEFRQYFSCPVAAIVRDGRYTVRSMLARKLYQKEGRPGIYPQDNEVALEWDSMSPLAKTSWYWADTYRRLLDLQIPTFRLEDLCTDTARMILLSKHLGIEVDIPTYEKLKHLRIHQAIDPKEPLGWTSSNMAEFMRFAGDIQSLFNYPQELPT